MRDLLKARENVLNSFRNNVFPIINTTLDTKPDTTPDATPQQSIFYMPKQTGAKSRISKTETSPFKLNKNFVSKIKNDEEKLNTEIFKKYFGYQNPSFLAKDLFKANQVIINQIVSLAFYSNNELRNAVIRKEIPENENPKNIIHIIEKVLEFNNRQKGNGLKISTLEQMLQRLPIVLAQVKAGNNSENSLNEIRKIVCSLYQPKEITKKVYKNIIKSIEI